MRQFSLSAAIAGDAAKKNATHARKIIAASLMHLNDIKSKSLPYKSLLLKKMPDYNNDAMYHFVVCL